MSSGAVFELGVRRRTEPYFPRWSNLDLDKYESQFRRDLAIEYRQEGGVVAPFQIPTLVQYRNSYTPPSLPLAPRSRNPRTPAFRRLTRLKAPPRPYHAPSPTINGLPKYWPNSDSPTGIARVRRINVSVVPDRRRRRHWRSDSHRKLRSNAGRKRSMRARGCRPVWPRLSCRAPARGVENILAVAGRA